MKRGLIIALVLLFGMASAAMASVTPNVIGNTSQQGSVLIFPKVDVSGSNDTLISISNGNPAPVSLECYWVDSYQNFVDFQFTLTGNQPVAFSALFGSGGGPCQTPQAVTVPPFPAWDSAYGELKCWAVDAGGANQIAWNYLSGSAKVVNYEYYTAYEYNAWSFGARTSSTGADGGTVGTGGVITLDGVNYDACPAYFLGNFYTPGSGYNFFKDTDLTLVACKEDLRQDRTPTYTKAYFDIWNENETEYSGTTECIRCWKDSYLSYISSSFNYMSLHTAAARFRTHGIASTVCLPAALQVASPLIGVLVEYLDFSYGQESDSIGSGGSYVTTASTGFGSGQDNTGFIKWDTMNQEVSAKKAAKKTAK